jgi:hypothetical protein
LPFSWWSAKAAEGRRAARVRRKIFMVWSRLNHGERRARRYFCDREKVWSEGRGERRRELGGGWSQVVPGRARQDAGCSKIPLGGGAGPSTHEITQILI